MKKYRISDYEQADYSSLWVENQRKYDDRIERIVLTELIPEGGDWFVDLGCAHGRLTDIYRKRFKQCVLLDYSLNHLKLAVEKWRDAGNASFIAANIYRLPFKPESIDAIMMVRVLHHLEAPDAALGEVSGILKNEGTLITNYRNRRDLRNMLRFALGFSHNHPFRLAHDDPSGENKLQAYTHPRFARNMLESAGFRIKRVRGTSFFGGKMLRLLSNPAAVEAPLSGLLGRLQLSPLIFVKAQLARGSNEPKEAPLSLNDILACPDCKGNLEFDGSAYYCAACDVGYPVIEGIIDFRGNE